MFRRSIKNNLTETLDLVVRAKPGIREAGYSEIADDLIRILKQQHLIKDLAPEP